MEGKWLFFPPFLMQRSLANHKPAAYSTRVPGWESAEHAGREMRGIVGWMFWQGGELSEPCTDPRPPAEERRLGIRTDGWGWRTQRSPAEAERGRIEETAGTREVEVGEEREACQHFVQTSWRGKHKQTASDSSRGSEGGKREEERRRGNA